MADDLYAAAEQARQQSDAFMQRSREQMQASFASQRAMAVGVPAGAAPAVAAGVGGTAMLAGTPAGRLLETITSLIRRGTGVAGAAVGGPIATAGGGFRAIGAGVAGAAGFMTGDAPFGPAGMGGGAMQGVQNRMGVMQMLYAGYGGGLPMGLGRFAGQRMDMTERQAVELAKEESKYRLVGGAMKGVQSAWNIASLGMSNFVARREGLELDWFRGEDFNRSVQQNMRFMTTENLERAGLGRFRNAFPTGITREGAQVIGAGQRQALSDIQRQTGASAEQLIALGGRAMGTMGAVGLNQLMGQGLGAYGRGLQRNTEAMREIQKGLNLSEEEADQFTQMMGQLHGSATRIAEMVRTSRRAAGRMGMDVRDVMGITTEFERMGRTQMIGQAATGRAGLAMAENIRGWQMSGIMTREEAGMYGGNTYEEGLKIMSQRAFQMGTQMFNQGQLGGAGLMMRYAPGQYQRLAGGGMGAMEMAGVVGGMVAADPTMQLRARYDERIQRQTGQEGLRAQYARVQARARDRSFIFEAGAGLEEEMYQAFERNTGMRPLEAKKWFQFFDRESDAIQAQVSGAAFKGNLSIHQENIRSLHSKMRSEGTLALAQRLTGKSEYDAVGQIYRDASDTGKNLTVGKNTPTAQLLRQSFMKQEQAIVEQRMGETGIHGVAVQMGVARMALRTGAVGPASMAVLGEVFGQQGLTAEQTFRELLNTGEGIGFDAPKANERVRTRVLERAGFKVNKRTFWGVLAGDVTDETRGVMGWEVGGVASIVEEGTDVSANAFMVSFLGQKQKMTRQEIRETFPKLGNILTDALLQNTEGLDTVSGLQGAIKRRGSTGQVQARFREYQNNMAMDKYRDMATYLFGRGGVKMKFGDFVGKLRGAAAGKGDAVYQGLMERLPDLKQFLAAAAETEGGGADIGKLQKFFEGGGTTLSAALREATGKTPEAIEALLGAGGLDVGIINSLTRHVMDKQSMESTPLGGMMNANYMKMAESSIQSLAAAIGDAVAEAITPGSKKPKG